MDGKIIHKDPYLHCWSPVRAHYAEGIPPLGVVTFVSEFGPPAIWPPGTPEPFTPFLEELDKGEAVPSGEAWA